MNLLDNGNFDNLTEWTTTGELIRDDGYYRNGSIKLDNSEYVRQQVSLSEDHLYSCHFFWKPTTGATLTVSYGSIEQTFSGVVGQWQESVFQFALTAPGDDSIQFVAVDASVYVDAVTLVDNLPLTRARIASQVARRLGDLATDAGISTVASATGVNGDYTDAIDEALRSVSSVDMYATPDVTRVTSSQVNDVMEAAYMAALQNIRASYALQTDVTLGPRRESRSQIAASIDAMLGSGGGGGANKRIAISALNRSGGWER